jgi:hypothetical protein
MYFKSKQPREVREMMQREEALTLHISPSTNSIVEFRSRKKIQKEILIVINFLFLLLMSNFINAQTFSHNVQYPVQNTVDNVSTSSNPYDYDNWYEEPSNKQSVSISIIPTEKEDLYIQKDNSTFGFNTFNTSKFIVSLSLNWDNTGNQNVYTGSSKQHVNWINPPASYRTLGTHQLKVQATLATGEIIYREYSINITQNASKFYKNNLSNDPYYYLRANTLTLWENTSNPNAIPVLISEGFDAYNSTSAEFYAYEGQSLINALLANGYKVYVLDYEYNAQSMKNSAAIYNSAIRYVSSINANRSVIAGGISMGGVIARYALTKAENDLTPLPVSKFVSIDAPQQGAVVSKQFQDYTNSKTDDQQFEAFGINNTAAKQLLKYNTYDNTGIHSSFYSELNAMNCGRGYPKLTQNIGVAFSNGQANTNSGQWLLIKFGSIISGESIILSSEEKVSGSFLPRSSTNFDPSPTNALFSALFPGYVTFTRYSDPTFIPYASSLDLNASNQSKFDVSLQANANGYHDKVPTEIINPLISALNAPYAKFDYENLTVSTNVSWSTNKKIKGTITIQSGAQLSINNAQIDLYNNASIVVEVGGKLILTNSKLTNTNCNTWTGIQVKGNANATQLNTNQGYVYCANSTIEKCKNMINVNAGGIFIAMNSNFKNSYGTYIHFDAYQSTLTNRSAISNCFFTSANPIGLIFNNKSYIDLQEIKGIKIINCDFSESTYPTTSNFSAIRANDASIQATGNTITGLPYGVLFSSSSSVNQSSMISDNSITNCMYGMKFLGGTNLDLHSNTFSNNTIYALKLEQTLGFSLAENSFVNLINRDYSIGVLVNNSNTLGGQIYKNQFTGFKTATAFENNNPNVMMKCNQYTAYDVAISVTSGILGNQGAYTSQNQAPIANYFSSPINANAMQFYVSENASSLQYTTFSNTNLTKYSASKVTQNICANTAIAMDCPSIVSSEVNLKMSTDEQYLVSKNTLGFVTPNPFSKMAKLHCNIDVDASAYVKIYNAIGQEVKIYALHSGENEIELNALDLGDGLFQAVLLVNGLKIDTRKFISTKR